MKARKQISRGGLSFLRTETETDLTFADLALHSDDATKIKRNRLHARTAYYAIVHYRDRVVLSRQEAHEINTKLALLMSRLLQLGDSF